MNIAKIKNINKIRTVVNIMLLVVAFILVINIESNNMMENILPFFIIIIIFVNIYFFVIFNTAHKKLSNELQYNAKKSIDENRKKDELLFSQSKHAAMGEMIGSIAHQWRQPLNAIAGNIQMVEFDYEDKLIDKKYVKTLIESNMKIINFMSSTIDDFRDFFKTDKVKKEFKAKKSIQNTYNLISAQLNSKNIIVEIMGDESCVVYGYESEFQQVVINIINNAKDELVSKKINDGKITIHIFYEMNFTVFKIADNAGGIPDNVIDRIFEPYYTTKEQGMGTGLGLYMSRTIVENNMGGHISVENINGGAVFTIAFINK